MATGIQLAANITINCSEIKNSVKSFELSKKYLKRLMKIAVLNIIYRRIDLPDSEFVKKTAFSEKIQYVVFKNKSQNEFIKTFHSYAAGIVDALEKSYLKTMHLFVINKANKEILETYTFNYKYNEKVPTKTTKDSSEVRDAMTYFLDALASLPGNKWPENDVEVLCELNYNENTPKEYQPPNFQEANPSLSTDNGKFVKLGQVNTGFHKLSVWGTGTNFWVKSSTPTSNDILNDDEEEEEEMQHHEFTEDDMQNKKLTQNNKRKAKLNKNEVRKKPTPANNETVESEFFDGNINLTTVSSEDLEVCSCKWRNLDDNYQMMKCTQCFALVHTVCSGYLTFESIDKEKFICLPCHCPENNSVHNMITSQLRLVLYGMQMDKTIPSVFRLARKVERNRILDQLEDFGVLKKGSTNINEEALGRVIETNFLHTTETSQYLN